MKSKGGKRVGWIGKGGGRGGGKGEIRGKGNNGRVVNKGVCGVVRE